LEAVQGLEFHRRRRKTVCPRAGVPSSDPALLLSIKARLSALPKDVLVRFPDVDPEVVLEPFVEHIQTTPTPRWAIVQRAFWVHGVDSLSE
jgi:hypothetical protein